MDLSNKQGIIPIFVLSFGCYVCYENNTVQTLKSLENHNARCERLVLYLTFRLFSYITLGVVTVAEIHVIFEICTVLYTTEKFEQEKCLNTTLVLINSKKHVSSRHPQFLGNAVIKLLC